MGSLPLGLLGPELTGHSNLGPGKVSSVGTVVRSNPPWFLLSVYAPILSSSLSMIILCPGHNEVPWDTRASICSP